MCSHKIFLPIIFTALFLLSCDEPEDRAIDNKRISQAIRDRKPQRINQKDLLEWVKRKGVAWTFVAQKNLYRQVKRALADSTLKKIQDFDKLESLPAVDSITQQYQCSMQGYSFATKNTLDTEISELLTAFKKSQASQETVVKMSKNAEFVYFATPIVIDNETVGAWLISLPAKTARRWFDRKELR